MFHKLNKTAQSTAEYAILIAIVVGALIGMQVYVRRGLQGRIADVVDSGALITTVPAGTGLSNLDVNFSGRQYEPYYVGAGEITQTGGGSRGRTGDTDTSIEETESGYFTDRTGTRTSVHGVTLTPPAP